MTHEFLAILWFIFLGIFLAGYAILDGFDLGVGMLHPFLAKSDQQRRIFMNAIGPLWDGNEVWLIVFGGSMMAAFPEVYATVFSGFYNALMLVLLGLILRAVSLEFRSKMHVSVWRRFWDWGFFLGSLLPTVVFGLAVGNAMQGLPLNERGEPAFSFLDLFNPYALLVGAFTVAMFLMHGAIFLYLKTPDSELRDRLREWMWHTWGLFLVLYVLTTIYTLVSVERATMNFERWPWAGVVVVLNVLAIANIPRAIYHGRPLQAFFSSCVAIGAFVSLFSLALFPVMLPSVPNPENSLTVFNSASSATTLTVMTIVAAIGTPLVLTYTAIVYWTFRGEVELEEHSY